MDLNNHFLIAMPDMRDAFFSGSVVYVCRYSAEEGATGVVINKPSPLPVRQILTGMKHAVPPQMEDDLILIGGPVQTDRGFLLHSPAGSWLHSLPVGGNLALTSSGDILEHLDDGKVERALLLMGYSGWTPGQLEQELADNSWLTVAADEDILFRLPYAERYGAAVKLLHITPEQLGAGGHA